MASLLLILTIFLFNIELVKTLYQVGGPVFVRICSLVIPVKFKYTYVALRHRYLLTTLTVEWLIYQQL